MTEQTCARCERSSGHRVEAVEQINGEWVCRDCAKGVRSEDDRTTAPETGATEETDEQAMLAVERESSRLARGKAIYQYRQHRIVRARLARVVTWANARLSLDGFEPQDTPFHMSVNHAVAWKALEPGDLDPVENSEVGVITTAVVGEAEKQAWARVAYFVRLSKSLETCRPEDENQYSQMADWAAEEITDADMAILTALLGRTGEGVDGE